MTETDFAWRAPEELPAPPKRVIWHWTAGARTSTPEERARYHILLEHHEGDPADPLDDEIAIRAGVPIGRNMRSVEGLPGYHRNKATGYGAHTRGFNSYSIGLAACGMRRATDYRPDGGVNPGPSPITLEQVRALLAMSVSIHRIYELEVTPETFFSHYEAESLHGVDQLPEGPEMWKWNLTWIPGLGLSRERAGYWLREQLTRWIAGEEIDDRLYEPPAGASSREAVRGQEG